jgi:hypothetical protein
MEWREDQRARLLTPLTGVGDTTATAPLATIGNGHRDGVTLQARRGFGWA